MKNTIVPTASKKDLVKTQAAKKVRAFLKIFPHGLEPSDIFTELDDMMTEYGSGKVSRDALQKKIEAALLTIGHERHLLVAESITDERWRPMVIDLAKAIQDEYQCLTPSEISLAGLAASAYYRSLRAARKVNALLEQSSIGSITVQLFNFASKEVDRAERQYLTAIETLRSRRQPQINVKVHTKAAFFGNQTIHTESSPEQYENNDQQ